MENCVSAAHRAVRNAWALRDAGIGRQAATLTARQEQRLGFMRHAVEHSDEKVQRRSHGKSPAFAEAEPFSLRLSNRAIVIGQNVLTYTELVSSMTKMARTIEVIRGVPTGSPGPKFANASLRTDPGNAATGQTTASAYVKELTRLVVTHS